MPAHREAVMPVCVLLDEPFVCQLTVELRNLGKRPVREVLCEVMGAKKNWGIGGQQIDISLEATIA